MKKIASILLIGIFAVSAGSVALASSSVSKNENKTINPAVKTPVITVSASSPITQPIQNATLSLTAVLPDFNCDIEECTIHTQHTHSLCNSEGCDITQTHDHDGTLYYGHHDNDGHDHQPPFVCPVSGCDQNGEHSHSLCNKDGCGVTGTHSHNGTLYYGHHDGDGHGHGNYNSNNDNSGNNNVSYDNAVSDNTNNVYCPVSGCTQSGEHSHDNQSGHHGQGHGGRHH